MTSVNLKIFQQENQYRKNRKEITDDKLILWEQCLPEKEAPKSTGDLRVLVPVDPRVLVPGSPHGFISPSDFNKRFHAFTKGILSYLNWDHLVLAGGCVSNIINSYCHPKYPTDLDLFLYGLTDPVLAQAKILEVVMGIKQFVKDNLETDVVILKNQYVTTILPRSNKYKKYKVQIIHRMYRNIYEILAGFDVDSCTVAFNGRQVFLTPRSLHAFQTKLNVVDLERRSPSYEFRLFKYYKRGFGIYIPFEYRKEYNKLYFMNRYSKGLDRLLYLIKFQKKNNFSKFLNNVTQRINTKIPVNPVGDYEGIEFDIEKRRDLQGYVSKYNSKVDPEFRFTLFYSLKEFQNSDTGGLKSTQFKTQDPGQQLTGSFHPITEGEWIQVDYCSDGIDQIGRKEILVEIKNNRYNLMDLYDQRIYDNSLFNPLDYLIMYATDEEGLIQAWDNRHRFCQSINLYKIGYLELAIVMGREVLVDNILVQMIEKANGSGNGPDWDALIRLCIVFDAVNILQILYKHINAKGKMNSNASASTNINVNNNANEFRIDKYRKEIETYQSANISEFYCIKIKGLKTNNKSNYLTNLTIPERISYFHHNQNRYDIKDQIEQVLKSMDYQQLSLDELRIMLYLMDVNQSQKVMDRCLKDLRKTIKVEEKNLYSEGSFEHFWYQSKLDELQRVEDQKDPVRVQKAYELIHKLFPNAAEVLKDKKHQEIVFTDPIKKLNPINAYFMKLIFQHEFQELEGYKKEIKLWNKNSTHDDLRDLIFKLDDLEILQFFIAEKHMGNFLELFEKDLGPKLYQYWLNIKDSRLNLKTEDIYETYAHLFHNTSDHIDSLRSGLISDKYPRKENLFGMTPCDYVINQLLYSYSYIYVYKTELKEEFLKKLVNLRQSFTFFDRKQEIEVCSGDSFKKMELEDLINRV